MRFATWEFFFQYYSFKACKPSCSKFFSGSAAEAAGLWNTILRIRNWELATWAFWLVAGLGLLGVCGVGTF